MEKRSPYKYHIEYSYENSTRIPCVSVFLTTKRNLCFVGSLRCARSTKVCSVSMNSLPTTCAPEIALYGRVHALKILCEREHLAYTRVSRSRAPERSTKTLCASTFERILSSFEASGKSQHCLDEIGILCCIVMGTLISVKNGNFHGEGSMRLIGSRDAREPRGYFV